MLLKLNRKRASFAWLGICLTSLAISIQAKELPEGTVISAANLDEMYEDTFEGHKIKDLLTERFEMWVRDYGLTMELERRQRTGIRSEMGGSHAAKRRQSQPGVGQESTGPRGGSAIPEWGCRCE